MRFLRKSNIEIVAMFCLALFLCSCASSKTVVTPDKTVLSPALIKKPIVITGSGFQPKETVVVELIVPKGVELKGLKDVDKVGIAVATADDKGNFKTKVGAIIVLQTFFQVGWKNGKPDFKQAKPLPPRKYEILSTGVMSNKECTSILEFVPPPKKK